MPGQAPKIHRETLPQKTKQNRKGEWPIARHDFQSREDTGKKKGRVRRVQGYGEKQRQVDLCELKDSLVYSMSSGTGSKATQRNPALKNKQNQKQQKLTS